MEQRTNVPEFVLLGLIQSIQGQKILFVLFLLIYTVTMVGKGLNIMTVLIIPTLNAPMYFFLGYLSFMDTVYFMTVTPNMITDLIYENKTILLLVCKTKLFIGHLFGDAKIIFLVVMTYDLYVPFCKPLHYLTIVNQWVCFAAAIGLGW